jgi:hypothetical protein
MSAQEFHKRFPVARRRACVPVTSTRTDGTVGSRRARAVGQASGGGEASVGSGPAPVDLNIKRIKGVVEK